MQLVSTRLVRFLLIFLSVSLTTYSADIRDLPADVLLYLCRLQPLDADSIIALNTTCKYANNIISVARDWPEWVIGKQRTVTFAKKENSNYDETTEKLKILPSSILMGPDRKRVMYLLYNPDSYERQFLRAGYGNLCVTQTAVENKVAIKPSTKEIVRFSNEVATYASAPYGYRDLHGKFFLFCTYNVFSRRRTELACLQWSSYVPIITAYGTINLVSSLANITLSHVIKKAERNFSNDTLTLTFYYGNSIDVDLSTYAIVEQRRPLQQWTKKTTNSCNANPENSVPPAQNSSNNTILYLISDLPREKIEQKNITLCKALKLHEEKELDLNPVTLELDTETKTFFAPDERAGIDMSADDASYYVDLNTDILDDKPTINHIELFEKRDQRITYLITSTANATPRQNLIILDLTKQLIITSESCLAKPRLLKAEKVPQNHPPKEFSVLTNIVTPLLSFTRLGLSFFLWPSSRFCNLADCVNILGIPLYRQPIFNCARLCVSAGSLAFHILSVRSNPLIYSAYALHDLLTIYTAFDRIFPDQTRPAVQF